MASKKPAKATSLAKIETIRHKDKRKKIPAEALPVGC
jgi:hypothetical protein